MPEPRAPKQDRTLGQQAASRVRKVGRAASRFDVALGPAEVPLGSIIGILAGAVVGAAPAIIFRSGILLPIGLILGGIVGGVAGAFLRRRLTFRGWRLGVVGVLLLGLLIICVSCQLLSTISMVQKGAQSIEMSKRLDELVGPRPSGAAQNPTIWSVPVPIFRGVVCLGGVGIVVFVGLLLLFLRRK